MTMRMDFSLATFAAACLLILSGAFSPVHADTLVIDRSSQQTINMPNNGIAKADVEAKFGTPVSKHSAVGTPPISKWDYGNFIVYFEHDLVLHTVARPYVAAVIERDAH